MRKDRKKGGLHILAILLAALVLLNGCGAKESTENYFSGAGNTVSWDEAPAEIEEEMESSVPEMGSGFSEEPSVGPEALADRKLIKNVDLEVETLDYDALTAGLEQKVEEFSGYVENSELSGKSIYSNGNTRYASYTVRIPKESLEKFIGSFSEICNVISKRETVEDVTLQYVDTESRKKSLQVEQERLFVLLEKAESIETVIALETRLSEVRYQIENYESVLRTYDNQVDYSTVFIFVREVERMTEPAAETSWQRIKHGFSDSVFRVTKETKELFIWLVISIPYFAVLGIFVLLAVLVIRFFRQRLKKRAQKRNKAESKEHKQEEGK